MEALTPTHNPEAREWRAAATGHHRARADARCRAVAAVGARIRLNRPYTYRHGISAARHVVVCSPIRWRRAEATDSGVLSDGPRIRTRAGQKTDRPAQCRGSRTRVRVSGTGPSCFHTDRLRRGHLAARVLSGWCALSPCHGHTLDILSIHPDLDPLATLRSQQRRRT